MPIKERRTRILLLLFLATGVEFGLVELSPAFQEIFEITLNRKTRGTLSALIKEGLIEKEEGEDQKIRYRLTEKGFLSLCLIFPFFRFLKEEWDGRWRVISYEIPEKKREIRDRLRREMKGWGLGPWHRSFWLTPHPVIENLRDLVYGREEEKYVQAFESTHVFGDMETLVEKVWGKTELDKRYRELFKNWHDILSKDLKKEEKLKQAIALYVDILRHDPGLPPSLIGKDWTGFEAFSIFKEVREILLR